MTDKPCCGICRFWDNSVGHRDVSDSGRCVVKPPKIHRMTGCGIWPFTEGNDWCGAYEAKPAL